MHSIESNFNERSLEPNYGSERVKVVTLDFFTLLYFARSRSPCTVIPAHRIGVQSRDTNRERNLGPRVVRNDKRNVQGSLNAREKEKQRIKIHRYRHEGPSEPRRAR